MRVQQAAGQRSTDRKVCVPPWPTQTMLPTPALLLLNIIVWESSIGSLRKIIATVHFSNFGAWVVDRPRRYWWMDTALGRFMSQCWRYNLYHCNSHHNLEQNRNPNEGQLLFIHADYGKKESSSWYEHATGQQLAFLPCVVERGPLQYQRQRSYAAERLVRRPPCQTWLVNWSEFELHLCTVVTHCFDRQYWYSRVCYLDGYLGWLLLI